MRLEEMAAKKSDDEIVAVSDKEDEKIRALQKQDALKPDNFDIISTLGTKTFNDLPPGKFFITTKIPKDPYADDEDEETSSTEVVAEIEPDDFFKNLWPKFQEKNPRYKAVDQNQLKKDLTNYFNSLATKTKNTFLRNLAIKNDPSLSSKGLKIAGPQKAARYRYRNPSDLFTPNKNSTPEQVLNAYMAAQKQLKTNEFLTVGNIKDKLTGSGRSISVSQQVPGKKTPIRVDQPVKTNAATQTYMGDLIDNFTQQPGRRDYPVTLIPDLSEFKKTTGLKTETSVVTDFCEILAPIALLTDNLNGNASETVKKFLGIDSFNNKVLQSASINFKPATNGAMIDSIINYNGKNISISSKTNGGRGASLSGVKNAMVEIKQNPEAVEMLKKILAKNEDYQDMYEFLDLVTGSSSRFDQNFEALEFFFEGDFEPDLALAKTLDNEKQISPNAWKKFSPEIRGIYSSYYDAKTSGNSKSKIKPIPTMKRFREGLTWAVARQANSTPYFSELVTWIFNHGAVIQVDATTNTGPYQNLKTGGEDTAIVLSNFTGTWPSQCVETVELVEDDTSSFLNRLHINGFNKQFAAGNRFRVNPDNDFTQWRAGEEGLPNRTYDIDDPVDPADRSAGDFPRTKTRNDWQDPKLGDQRRWISSPLGGKGSAISLGISQYQAYQYATLTDEQLLAAGVPADSDTMADIQAARKNTISTAADPAKVEKLAQGIKNTAKSTGYIRNMNDLDIKNINLQKYEAVRRLQQIQQTDPDLYQTLVTQSGAVIKTKDAKANTKTKKNPTQVTKAASTQNIKDPGLAKIQQFFANYNADGNTVSRAVTWILDHTLGNRTLHPQFEEHLKRLFNDQDVLAHVRDETRKLVNQFAAQVTEGKVNVQHLDALITLLYYSYALTLIRKNPQDPRYNQYMTKIQQLLQILGVDRAGLRKYFPSVNTAGK